MKFKDLFEMESELSARSGAELIDKLADILVDRGWRVASTSPIVVPGMPISFIASKNMHYLDYVQEVRRQLAMAVNNKDEDEFKRLLSVLEEMQQKKMIMVIGLDDWESTDSWHEIAQVVKHHGISIVKLDRRGRDQFFRVSA